MVLPDLRFIGRRVWGLPSRWDIGFTAWAHKVSHDIRVFRLRLINVPQTWEICTEYLII